MKGGEGAGGFHAPSSDLLLTIEQAVATGTRVAVLIRIDVVHTGRWKGFTATGRAVSSRKAGCWTVDQAWDPIVAGMA